MSLVWGERVNVSYNKCLSVDGDFEGDDGT